MVTITLTREEREQLRNDYNLTDRQVSEYVQRVTNGVMEMMSDAMYEDERHPRQTEEEMTDEDRAFDERCRQVANGE